MFKFSKKKLIFCLLGIALCVVAIVLSMKFSYPGVAISELPFGGAVVRYLTMTCISLVMALIFLTFSNKKVFWIVFGGFQFYLTLLFFTYYFSESNINVSRSILASAIAGVILYLLMLDFNRKQKAINGVKSEKDLTEEKQALEEINALIKEDEKFKSEIGYIDKSIVLATKGMGNIFQVVKMNGYYYFHRVGSILKETPETNYIKNFDNIEEVIGQNSKDYKINASDILEVKAKISTRTNALSFGSVTIKQADGKSKKFELINLMEEEELKSFFLDKVTVTVKEAEPEANYTNNGLSNERKQRLNKVNTIIFVCSVLTTAILSVYWFFNTSALNPYVTALSILASLSFLIIYMVYNDCLYLVDSYDAEFKNGKLNYAGTFVFFPFIFSLKTLIMAGFVLEYDYLRLFIYSAILFAILMILLCVFRKRPKTSKTKQSKIYIFYFVIVLLAFAPSAVAEINNTYDFSEPQEIVCVVLDTHKNISSDGKYYYVVVDYNGKEVKCRVGADEYETINVGDEKIALQYNGALGIKNTTFA